MVTKCYKIGCKWNVDDFFLVQLQQQHCIFHIYAVGVDDDDDDGGG